MKLRCHHAAAAEKTLIATSAAARGITEKSCYLVQSLLILLSLTPARLPASVPILEAEFMASENKGDSIADRTTTTLTTTRIINLLT